VGGKHAGETTAESYMNVQKLVERSDLLHVDFRSGSCTVFPRLKPRDPTWGPAEEAVQKVDFVHSLNSANT
jgi:hypothetical protein